MSVHDSFRPLPVPDIVRLAGEVAHDSEVVAPPAVVPTGQALRIIPAQRPPAPTPIGNDANAGFRNRLVKLMKVAHSQNFEPPDTSSNGWAALASGLREGEWAIVANGLRKVFDGATVLANDGQRSAVEQFPAIARMVQPAHDLLIDALAPCDLDFATAECRAMISGLSAVRDVGSTLLTDCLNEIDIASPPCGAVALASRSVKLSGQRAYGNPRLDELVRAIEHHARQLKQLAGAVAYMLPLAADPGRPAALLAGRIERQQREQREANERWMREAAECAHERARHQEKLRAEKQARAELVARQEAENLSRVDYLDALRRGVADEELRTLEAGIAVGWIEEARRKHGRTPQPITSPASQPNQPGETS